LKNINFTFVRPQTNQEAGLRRLIPQRNGIKLGMRGLLVSLIVFGSATGCTRQEQTPIGRLTVGVVSYGEGDRSLTRYEKFKEYLAIKTKAVVELEPAYNELNALQQIQQKRWSLVFAPPGLAAIAMDKHQYLPLLPAQGVNNIRSVLVVSSNSSIQSLPGLNGQIVSLGQPGSATGYYLPLYDLYGLTLREIRFAPTPKTALQWVQQGTVAASAISEEEYQRFRAEFGAANFRVLHTSRKSPVGVVLLGPTVDRNQQQQITQIMNDMPAAIADDAGFVPNAKVPDYQEFIKLVNKVKPIETHVKEKPAALLKTSSETGR
jgi:phosphonate transport system substrate-binding protein